MPTYKVVGPHQVFDTAPGDTFTKKLPKEQERNLIAGGHIEKKSDSKRD